MFALVTARLHKSEMYFLHLQVKLSFSLLFQFTYQINMQNMRWNSQIKLHKRLNKMNGNLNDTDEWLSDDRINIIFMTANNA